MQKLDTLSDRLGSILIVGGGKMGEAILSGLLASDAVDKSNIVVANPGREKRERLSATYGVYCVASATEVAQPNTCVMCVKPQVIRDVMQELVQANFEPTRVISIAAGITTATIAEYFPNAYIVRGMPNTPLMVGQGMVALSSGANTPDTELQLAVEMFASMGSAIVVPESLQDAVVGLSGSGPAYFAMFLEAMIDAGTQMGLECEMALELSLQTMIGTGELLRQTGKTPAQLIEDVSSPGGTTVAALGSMRSAGVDQGIVDGCKAACERSKELS